MAKSFKQMIKDGDLKRADAMKARLEDLYEEPGFNLRAEGESWKKVMMRWLNSSSPAARSRHWKFDLALRVECGLSMATAVVALT